MESIVEIEINVSQAKLMELFADPRNNPLWMNDIEKIEPISGQMGMPGSTYRLVPKRGPFTFIATVVSRELPNRLALTLDAKGVSVSVAATLEKISDTRTKLISRETFRFNSIMSKVFGLFSGNAIRAAHRHHMEAFKRYAESKYVK